MKRTTLFRFSLWGAGVYCVMLAGLSPGLLAQAGAAQPQPTLVLSPSSGPCDGVVEVTGSGFPVPSAHSLGTVRLYLLQPGSADVSMGFLPGSYVRQDGTLGQRAGPLGGCDAAALDSQAGQPTGHLVIAATLSYAPLDPGARVPDTIATAQYAYTTTAPPSQPTLEISPASGPCDGVYGVVEVRGSGFEPRKVPADRLLIYLLKPGTTDVSMETLTPAFPDKDGAFAQGVLLWKHGCEAAVLDTHAEQPTGYLLIAAASGRDSPVQPGDRIPEIIAVARYTYTTTTRYVPTEVLTISPSSGPCDGVVEATLTGFGPSAPVRMDIGRPHADGSMGIVATVTTDASGQFRGEIQLGDLGCEAASFDALHDGPTEPKEIHVWAGYEPARQSVPARALYTYTTTERGGGLAPHMLPAAGGGAEAPGAHRLPLAVPLTLGAAGLLLVLLALSARAKVR